MQTLAPMTPNELYRRLVGLGVNKGYASQISRGQRAPSLKLALKLFREGGLKIGPLSDASKSAIASLDKATAEPTPSDAPSPDAPAEQVRAA